MFRAVLNIHICSFMFLVSTTGVERSQMYHCVNYCTDHCWTSCRLAGTCILCDYTLLCDGTNCIFFCFPCTGMWIVTTWHERAPSPRLKVWTVLESSPHRKISPLTMVRTMHCNCQWTRVYLSTARFMIYILLQKHNLVVTLFLQVTCWTKMASSLSCANHWHLF